MLFLLNLMIKKTVCLQFLSRYFYFIIILFTKLFSSFKILIYVILSPFVAKKFKQKENI